MKIFAFIPARYGSSRFPGKPLALISGKPMIQHTYERALRCPDLEAAFVATDDDRIARCVQGFGGKVVMTASTHKSGTDRIAEAARKMGFDPDDIVVNIQGDQPLFDPGVISEMTRPLVTDIGLPMSTLKWRIQESEEIMNPNHVKVVTDENHHALYFSRHPIPYCRDVPCDGAHFKHLGFYAFRMSFLSTFTTLPMGVLEGLEKLEQLRALEHGYRIKVIETRYDSIEVDVPEDVGKIEESLSRPVKCG
ncbi:MAG: 3-deoxy-manno-octulosonate cytidylyltransferase [Deltaproteobacteria bacterium]|nr:3-deoxy-manno-octulosonate cytidylyltransferase [Deltaproteobacteria bacterium]MCF8119307.1 3-deoxy-manno-octulosonate cytidylyltransferase [Deltaproteobacteria bacterium]